MNSPRRLSVPFKVISFSFYKRSKSLWKGCEHPRGIRKPFPRTLTTEQDKQPERCNLTAPVDRSPSRRDQFKKLGIELEPFAQPGLMDRVYDQILDPDIRREFREAANKGHASFTAFLNKLIAMREESARLEQRVPELEAQTKRLKAARDQKLAEFKKANAQLQATRRQEASLTAERDRLRTSNKVLRTRAEKAEARAQSQSQARQKAEGERDHARQELAEARAEIERLKAQAQEVQAQHEQQTTRLRSAAEALQRDLQASGKRTRDAQAQSAHALRIVQERSGRLERLQNEVAEISVSRETLTQLALAVQEARALAARATASQEAWRQFALRLEERLGTTQGQLVEVTKLAIFGSQRDQSHIAQLIAGIPAQVSDLVQPLIDNLKRSSHRGEQELVGRLEEALRERAMLEAEVREQQDFIHRELGGDL